MWIEITTRISFFTVSVVTPYAGVWIEIYASDMRPHPQNVTPYAGVWIEMKNGKGMYSLFTSLPTRECGLKYNNNRRICL